MSVYDQNGAMRVLRACRADRPEEQPCEPATSPAAEDEHGAGLAQIDEGRGGRPATVVGVRPGGGVPPNASSIALSRISVASRCGDHSAANSYSVIAG
jgi:hypothetical protein